MYIKVRNVNNQGTPDLIVAVRKNTFISDIQHEILVKWRIDVSKQRLLYKGKELISKCRVLDYNIQVNDVIQLFIKCEKKIVCLEPPTLIDVESRFYLSDGTELVDAKCETYYCWCRATIVDIKMPEGTLLTKDMSLQAIEEKFLFYVKFEHKNFLYVTTFNDIRPRSTHALKFDELKLCDTVLVNFNFLTSEDIGHWYDMFINSLDSENKIIIGTIIFKWKKFEIPGIILKYEEGKIYKIEEARQLPPVSQDDSFPCRITDFDEMCTTCQNKKNKKCQMCGCTQCGSKMGFSDVIICNECADFYHYYCVIPKLEMYPRERDWYCPQCKNVPDIVLAGEEPKKKVSNKATKDDSKWGRGMACVGRTKQCTIVPMYHFGPIPGVEVGTRWKFRIQVSEAGVHRPPVYGIHGRESLGAFSLVIAGGYEDDIDYGKEFIYSGSGGKDMSNNRRTGGAQSKDQELTRNNKALAMSCNAKLNEENGAISKDWKKGKPVRVCRSYKLRKYSKYAPEDGIRYDGIYKVVKYYKEAGKSGFMIWKFLLRRDDPTPAPWEKGGEQFDVIFPDGYLEAKQAKVDIPKKDLLEAGSSKSDSSQNEEEDSSKSRKRPLEPIVGPNEKGKGKSTKKSFKIEPIIEKLMKSDHLNVSLWEECAEVIKLGKFQYTLKVQEIFKCIVCQEVLYKPVTTCPKHNTCHICLKRSFEAEMYNCPYCRQYLGPNFVLKVNANLSNVLKHLLPGYDQNRE